MAMAFLVTTFFVQNRNSKYESTLESELWTKSNAEYKRKKNKFWDGNGIEK
jgi:hypothetical protein